MKYKKSLVVFIMVLILPLFVSCGNKEINKDVAERKGSSELISIDSKNISIAGNEYYSRIDANNGNILYSTMDKNRENFYFLKTDSNNVPSSFCSFDLETVDVLDFALSSKEVAFFLILEVDGNNENIYVKKINLDGTEKTIKWMNEFHGGDEDDCYEWKITANEDDNILIYSKFAYCFMNLDGEVLDEKRWADESFYDVCFLEDGSAIVQQFINGQSEIGIWDVQTKEMRSIPGILQDVYFDFISNSNGDILYRTDSQLFSYSVSTGNIRVMLQWSDYGIVGDKIGKIYYDADNRLNCLVLQEESIRNISWQSEESIKQKTELLLGCFHEKAETRNAVVQFNNSNPEYRITIVDYWEQDNDTSVNNLYYDLIAGKGPDILLLDSLYIDDWVLGSKGVLDNLVPYMEKSDVLHKEDMVNSVYESLLNNGQLYMLPTNFTIDTLVTKEKWVADKRVWSTDDIMNILDNNPYLLEKTPISKEMMLQLCISYGMDIGTSKENLRLDKARLQQYIELAGRMPSEVFYTSDTSVRRQGQMLFEPNSFSDVKEYLYSSYVWGDDTIFAGYPGAAGNGAVIIPDNCFAINAKSSYKEKAWEFIESHFTDELQGTITPSWKFSTCNKILNRQLEASMKIDTYLDGEGNEREVPVISYFDDMENRVVEIYAAREEDIKIIRALIDGSVIIRRNVSPLVSIVMDEVPAYFTGQKTVNEVTDIIENRVNIYLNE
ncbi:hypothetical protein [Kineothrix sedimenti]|uniref:ABC-type glycerol-3-phosphate transport system substrate-binding protein n=1 Tax=Kineothrix sedimenti TaxID=3123317 RepID=A0ABZ3EVE2_9FIRM